MNENSNVNECNDRDMLARECALYAAEKTMAAWLRTGLASVGGGFAIIRFLVFENLNHRIIANVMGEILIIWGILILIFALRDYRADCKRFGKTIHKTDKLWVTITILIFILIFLFLFFISIGSGVRLHN